ncbi:hypothetical protein GCM10022223_05270 [Kineosporia mesophila]|uniref:Secreted protein with PEP-CTERM sorting signal n=1 Tax=Kineosporia mesophila TaxID=566012 RepID=A0ABP6YYB2_9ACTN|nr:hypothetical protein [Kineosporia mesophila]MCD5354264.1 hypothetical protein [Kineosporia mesophila]
MSLTTPARRRNDPVIGVVVVAIIAAVLWAYLAVRPVRDEAAEYHWLAVHGVREEVTVAQLGRQAADGAALTVIVETESGVDAFVDLEGSSQKVTAEGATVPVVLDQRLAPSVGSGVATDLLDHSFTGDYVKKLAPPAALAVIALLALVVIRRRRSSRR